MAAAHDRASGPFVPPSEMRGGADPLSDVLAQVRLTGALYFLIEATEPWGVEVPAADVCRAAVLPGAQHLVSFDAVLDGEGWVEMPGAAPQRFGPGDVLVFARSPPHRLVSAPGIEAEYDAAATTAFLRTMAAGRLPFATREGGGGRLTRYVCGYLGCDLRPFNPVLAALPPFLHVQRREGGPDLLDRLVALAIEEAAAGRPGGRSIRLRLSELAFVEVLRRHMETMAPDATGWLAGLRDPVAGRALSLLHARPTEDWTLERLAHDAAVSRSVLAERFAHLVGCPPIRYLTLWRMQIAAGMLRDGAPVAAAAGAAGYASEAAFSRAFKRATGAAPTAWRAGARAGEG
jgi:AraC-like DNA-binding protein